MLVSEPTVFLWLFHSPSPWIATSHLFLLLKPPTHLSQFRVKSLASLPISQSEEIFHILCGSQGVLPLGCPLKKNLSVSGEECSELLAWSCRTWGSTAAFEPRTGCSQAAPASSWAWRGARVWPSLTEYSSMGSLSTEPCWVGETFSELCRTHSNSYPILLSQVSDFSTYFCTLCP